LGLESAAGQRRKSQFDHRHKKTLVREVALLGKNPGFEEHTGGRRPVVASGLRMAQHLALSKERQ